jgi:hypothetical protein
MASRLRNIVKQVSCSPRARRFALAGLVALAAAPFVTSCGTAQQSVRGNAFTGATPTVTTIAPTIGHQGCVETPRTTNAPLVSAELKALLQDGCASAPPHDRVAQCMSVLARQLPSLTDAGGLALGYASLALELSPATTKRDQTLAMDVAAIRTSAGIESSLREPAIACLSRPPR